MNQGLGGAIGSAADSRPGRSCGRGLSLFCKDVKQLRVPPGVVERDQVMLPTVFIVDDDDAVRDSLKLLLEIHGMTVEDYGSTAEFAQHYRPCACGCLVLDQHLPGVTGLDFLSSVESPLRGLPVILMTGRGDSAIRDRAAQLGVSAYLEKPIGDGVLIDAIRRALKNGPSGCDQVENGFG